MAGAEDRPATRLAPSPTGALHLGNARTFLVNWALARRRGWRIVMRIDDLDGPRIRTGAAEGVLDTLRWLGIDWDGEPILQSRDHARHVDAMRTLARAGLAYPCALSRREIEEAMSAPHAGDHESRFPPELRPRIAARDFDDETTSWRFVTPPGKVRFDDEFAGPQTFDPSISVGDFPVWTARAQASYQLAVVVDDHAQGVTHVVRGDDLLDSTARQLLLMRALRLAPEPSYAHLPLVVGPDGRRLAKRHGDTRIDAYRARAVPPERIVGLVASWCGLCREPHEMTSGEFAAALHPASIPGERIVFREEHDAWLLSGS